MRPERERLIMAARRRCSAAFKRQVVEEVLAGAMSCARRWCATGARAGIGSLARGCERDRIEELALRFPRYGYRRMPQQFQRRAPR